MTTLAPVQLEANGRRAFYNEIDRYCCDWLSNLMDAGQIMPGKIDDRPIQELTPDDVRGYTRAHFFAGVAGWDIALTLTGWPDDRPVWTGSCPCQPFSVAGIKKGLADDRHLWPAWAALIAECRPATVFGEQVAAAIRWGWLDLVFTDLEAAGYACGSAVLPACSVSAPHRRDRLWFVADAAEPGRPGWAERDARADGRATAEPRRLRDARGVAESEGREQRRARERGASLGRRELPARGHGAARGVGNAAGAGLQGLANGRSALHSQRPSAERTGRDAGGLGDVDSEREVSLGGVRERADAERRRTGPLGGFWTDTEWLACSDGKARPAQSRFQPLAHGVLARPSKLRAYGNAIVPQVAAEFVAAFLDVRK